METFKNKLSIIIATKDRPFELERMLKSIEAQSCLPFEIIIVDAGNDSSKSAIEEFSSLKINYLTFRPQSSAKQRNVGIDDVRPDTSLIGFMDDDIVLEKGALEAMMFFWENANENIGGAALNMINHPLLYAASLKSLPLVTQLGLYSKAEGVVTKSGFQTMIGYINKNIFTQWLPTTATVWRKKVFDEFKFDEKFEGYSYIEDLDFSYRVNKKFSLMVVANSRYYHYPSASGRINEYLFGKQEVKNRIYFLKKNKDLSIFKCYIALIVRMLMSLLLFLQERKISYLKRIGGNCTELIQSILQK